MKAIFIKTFAAGAAALAFCSGASAALYTPSFGSVLPNVSNCDDCFNGPISFGAGHSINFFGNTYSSLYVGSNGYVTFGSGATSFTTAPLDTQTVGPMIAGLFTDLDSRGDAPSQVFANTATPGQIIATWDQMGHFSMNYGVRSTFQVVIRSDEFAVAPGEGQIGFFYGSITDGSLVSAGFGDGLASVNPGEVAFASRVAGTTLSNSSPRWFNLSGGTPTEVPNGTVPIPGTLALLGVGLFALGARRVKR